MTRPGAALWIGAVTAIAVTLLLAFGFVETLELPLRDIAVRALPSRAAAVSVVVTIDERSLREIGPWPWPRDVLAQIVSRAADAEAKGAILDILLADPRTGDDVLAAAMKRIPSAAVSVLVENEQWLVPAPLIREAGTVAHGNFELDRDGILRRFATTKQSEDRPYTALSYVAASMVRSESVPIGRTVAPMFRTPPRAIPQISALDLLRGRADTTKLRNKLVFIGPTALGLGDRVLTPVSSPLAPDPGVTVHAAATESLLRGERIRVLSPLAGGLLAGLAAGTIVQLRRRSRATRLTSMAILLLAATFGGYALLASFGTAAPFGMLVLAIVITGATVEARAMAASTQDLGIRLEEVATRMAEERAQEIESKRVLAHELKTPLASMRGLTQLLSGFDLNDAERRRVAKLLEAEAGKLQSMVGALLDLERLPLRDFQSSSAVFDLGNLVGARAELLGSGNDRVEATAGSGVMVRGDAMLIERVVDNLVGNALKYTDGDVRVEVRRVNGDAVVEVQDQGPGIAAKDRERIFQRFVRGSSAAGTEGLGLGLSLVSEVARWHGGTVSLESGSGGGSRFRFILPLVTETA